MIQVFIDIETTGLSKYKNGIWQIAAILYKDGQKFDQFLEEFRPLEDDVIEQKALDVSNKTFEDIENLELEAVDALSKLKVFLGQYIDPFNTDEKAHFYGYNSRFDGDFLRQWFWKLGDRYYGSWFWFPPIDVMNLAVEHIGSDRKELENFKQGTVAKHLGIEVDESRLHDALYDVELTIQIYNIVGKNPLN